MSGGLRRLRLWALASAALQAVGAQVLGNCWYGDYDEHRCCVLKDAGCWDAVYTAEKCCPGNGTEGGRIRVRGNPRCWMDGYTYDDCCVGEPKLGCWDDQFGPEQCCVDTPEDTLEGLSVTEQDFEVAWARTLTRVAEEPLGCKDSPPGLWEAVKRQSVALNVSRSYGMPGDTPPDDELSLMLRHVRRWLRNSREWEESKAACPAGALNAIDLVAMYIDMKDGEAEAKAAYALHQALVAELQANGQWPPTGNHWPLLAPGLEYPPRLLGLTEQHACHGTSLKFFMYRVEKLAHMTTSVLGCSQKMSQCTASVHIHRWLEAGGCLTADPQEADFFYVPAYEACYNSTACGYDNNTERCFLPDFDAAADLPHFARSGGVDHIFVFGCNLLPFTDPLMIQARQSVMVTVESFQAENYYGPNMLAWLSHWKDVLIPGYIPRWRIDAMLEFNRPMIKRKMLLAFHGHSSSNPKVGHMYKRSPLAWVRRTIIEYFWNVSSTSVGPPVKDYFQRMGASFFCLVPAGLTAWTIHLYEAFFFGCVPVILSDELTLPFQEQIDWPSLSLKVPTTIPMEELHKKLSAFSLGRLKAMYRNLAAARCWFDYSQGWGADSGASGCSPYRGLLAGLEARARSGAAKLYRSRAGPYWEPPPRT